MRIRFLSIPQNAQGADEYDHGVQSSENLIQMLLPEEEFEDLLRKKVFKQINDDCGIMIDDYESEIISSDNLKKCESFIFERPGVFRDAAQKAIEYGTFLALDF